ncbi:hypothetical protein [Cellulomonas palmilytica]|uniref:hypothetical protein n=1 Tax=Cellulomonas palmilytica TaxID=2608402 RepID=UPI001F1F8E26|nr:hypothetical protein [Cellulomonas palmilytica]UJP41785.1 hypothetical protein F1D97_13425 [Cellulomonas palmilytica]
MPDGIFVDTTELRVLAVDLTKAAAATTDLVRPVVQRGALNIKRDLQADAAASAHFKGMTSSISYDTEVTRRGVEAEIGPDKKRRGGALGNIAYFGTSRGGGTLDLDGPLAAEEPRLVASLAKALGKLL